MQDCVFCNYKTKSTSEKIYDYEHWRLFLHSDAKRRKMNQSAGLLVSKRHLVGTTELKPDESVELIRIVKDAAQRLCERVGTTYIGQEVVGFNQGADAGQTVFHCHIHVLPVAAEEPAELKTRGGMGGAFEALRDARLGTIG